MRTYSFDWATKKALTVYNSQTQKVKSIPNSIDEFGKFLKTLDGSVKDYVRNSTECLPPSQKSIMLFEFGGGDTFKIMAFRAGHTILQVSGKKIRDYRESLGKEKSDEVDAKLIYDYWKENNGDGATVSLNKDSKTQMPISEDKNGRSAILLMRNSTPSLPSPIKNKEGGAIIIVRNSITFLPAPFFPFSEQDASIAEIKILFREHEDLKKEMVREKLKRLAFKQRFEIAKVADDRIKKMLCYKQDSIVAREKELEQIKKVLEKKVKEFDIWDNYLKDIKAVGPVIASGLIGELGGKHFDSDESLKHYCGMVAKKDFHDYNRYVKVILFQFAEGIIKHRTPKWRELYDNMKVFYQEKHEDWSKGKVNNYAKKFIETKFLIEFYGNMRGGAGWEVSTRIEKNVLAPQGN